MGQIKHYNNGKWTIYTSGEGLSGYTGVTDTYYVGPDLNNDGNLTKANPDGTLVNLEKDTRPYKVYTALLTQSGADAPIVTVLENTIGNITISSYNTGSFIINSIDNLFIDATKIVMFGSFFGDTVGPVPTGTGYVFNYVVNSSSQLYVFVFDDNSSPASVIGGDGRYCPIEIRVYN